MVLQNGQWLAHPSLDSGLVMSTVAGEVVFIRRTLSGISDVAYGDAVLSDWMAVLKEEKRSRLSFQMWLNMF